MAEGFWNLETALMSATADQLERAIQFQQRGALAQAERLYRQLLHTEPQLANAWHLLGVLLAQQGLPDMAIDHIQHSLKLQPNLAQAHCNLGNIYLQQDRFAEATASY